MKRYAAHQVIQEDGKTIGQAIVELADDGRVLRCFPFEQEQPMTEWLGEFISTTMPDGPVKDMLVDGVIGGVGAVIVFVVFSAVCLIN